jgi:hypothetical protein
MSAREEARVGDRTTRPHRAAVPFLLCALVLAALAAGCSAGGPPAHRAWRAPTAVQPTAAKVSSITELGAAEIVDRAVKATHAAGFVRVLGQITKDEESFFLDMRYDATGGGGRIRTDGQTVEVLRIQREVWFSGDTDFWRRVGGDGAVPAYRNKYLKIPASDSRFASLLDTTYIAKLTQMLLQAKGPFAKQGIVTLRGQRAVVVVDRTKGSGGTLWIAAEGRPYLLRMQAAPDSAVAGTVDFLDYNKRVSLPPPDPRRVIDAKDLAEDDTGDDLAVE